MKGKMKPVDLTYSDKTADKNKEHRKKRAPCTHTHTHSHCASREKKTRQNEREKIKKTNIRSIKWNDTCDIVTCNSMCARGFVIESPFACRNLAHNPFIVCMEWYSMLFTYFGCVLFFFVLR